MSLSNTEVFAFTQVPSGIKKIWRKSSVSTDTLSAAAYSSRHRSSMIKSVQLQVEFDNLDTWARQEFDAGDDCNEDAIAVWRENRTFWSQLEAAVEKTVDSYIKTIREEARGRQNKTCDLPIEKQTTVIPSALHIDHTAPDSHEFTKPESILSVQTSVRPDESASVASFDVRELKRIMRAELRDRNHQPHKRKGGKSASLLSYVAGKR